MDAYGFSDSWRENLYADFLSHAIPKTYLSEILLINSQRFINHMLLIIKHQKREQWYYEKESTH